MLARFGDDPFIAVREPGKGRSAVFSSDCGPHWGPPAFVNWAGYGPLWTNLVTWLAGAQSARPRWRLARVVLLTASDEID